MGIGTPHIQDASYPFLIQANYRAGYFTHYAGEGTIRSCKLTYQGEEVDLCLCRSKAHFEKKGNSRILTLDPVEIRFSNLSIELVSTFEFEEGSSSVKVTRQIVKSSNPDAVVELNEYITACYGTTEYSEDMTGITLSLQNDNADHSISYEYKCREAEMEQAIASIPAIETRVRLVSKEQATAYYKEGYAFSPMFTLGQKSQIALNQEVTTWLKLEKAN